MHRHILILLCITLLGNACQLTVHRRPHEDPSSQEHASDAQVVGTAALAPDSAGRIEDQIREIIDRSAGRYGVYAHLLGTDFEVAIEADRTFFAASCYKIPLVLYLYEQALDGEIDLGEMLLYTEDDVSPGAGILKDEPPGSRHQLSYLASLAIIHSDNTAAHMLLRRLGHHAFKQYQADLGATSVPADRNLASPRDVGRFLIRLMELNDNHPGLFGDILEWMKEALPRDRIPAGLPDHVQVANKTGTWPGTFNDAALIFSGDSITILVVMSEEVPSYGDGMATIAKIAESLYSELHAN